MTMPRLPDSLSGLTAATLTALSGAAAWIVIIVALPQLLAAVTRLLTEGLPAIAAYRRNAMLLKHEDRYLTAADDGTGLPHIARSRTADAPADWAPGDAVNVASPPDPPP
ncbi:hypothetical protein ABZV29_38440 [Streptomyces sp. NPDC005236]|uniref:hypothetical protein n=1 Tax=Streptomyces sp. NPDC005236 TaxID=3157028 RepID=UPI0033AA9A8C